MQNIKNHFKKGLYVGFPLFFIGGLIFIFIKMSGFCWAIYNTATRTATCTPEYYFVKTFKEVITSPETIISLIVAGTIFGIAGALIGTVIAWLYGKIKNRNKVV